MALVHRTEFSSQVAFRFGNWFRVAPGLPMSTNRRRVINLPAFGLCGGLCYAALDYYVAHLPVPPQDTMPEAGTRLFRYLVRRQIDSLASPRTLPRILAWMFTRDRVVTSRTIEREWPTARTWIDRDIPIVLLLINVRNLADPTQNHQVVAVGYELDEGGQRASLLIYDPNYPGREPRIDLDLSGTGGSDAVQHSIDEGLRGFFVQPYRPRIDRLP